jgi:hypothetical protein
MLFLLVPLLLSICGLLVLISIVASIDTKGAQHDKSFR